ncbi:MAG: hypothetical protein WCS65_04525 [Verrucomicrobiae bacterium]
MPFQPIINSVGPALIEQGFRGAANSTLAGAQAMASGIQQAGSSLGQGIGSAVAEWSKRSQQMKANAGMLDSMGQSKIFPQEWLDKVSNEKDQDKLRGNLAFMQDYATNQMAQSRQIAVADAAAAAAKKEEFIPTLVNLGNGQQAFMQSRGSAQLIPNGQDRPPRILPTDEGYVSFNSVDNVITPLEINGNPVMPVGKGRPKDPVRAAQVAAIDGEIATLTGEVAKGNKKWGPDWLPGLTSYADQLRAKQAERDSLAGSSGRVPTAVVTPPAAPVDGTTATHPQTGEKMIFRNGQWMPVQ